MITLTTSGTLKGKAGTASVISYTINGDSVTTTDAFQVLGQGQLAATTSDLLTTTPVPASTNYLVKEILGNSTSGSNIAVTFYANGSGASNVLWQGTVPAGGSFSYNDQGWRIYDSNGVAQSVGSTGPAGTITIGTVTNIGTTGPPTVTNVGTGTAAILNFGLQQGATGSTGAPGVVQAVTAADSSITVGGTTANPTISRAALTGDIAASAGANATTLATVNSNVGTFGSNTRIPTYTVNAKGLTTASSDAPVLTTPSGQTPVGATRSIATTAPLTGGGDLSADRILAISAATTSTAGSQSAADKLKQNNSRIDIVAEYGADPTGTTAIDTAVANAMAALPSTGGRIFFPTGTYKLNATITVTKPIIFCGQGQNISVISMTHATQDVFSLTTGAQGAGFEDLRIIGATTGTRTGGYGINLGTQANTVIRRVDMLFMWSGVHSSGALQDIDGMNILNGGANAANGAAILVDSTGDRYIRRVVTNQGSSPTGYSAIRIRECSSCVIEACNLINSGNVLDIVPNAGAGHAVASVYAVDCFFDTSVIGVNIVPASASDTAQRMTFIRCWCSTMSTAGVVIGDGVVPNANINSVRFVGCEMYQAPVGIDAKGAGDWNVVESQISGNSTAGIRAAVGVGGGHSFSIVNNFIGNGAGFGVNGVGITIGAGTYGHYQITGNRGLDTNTTVGIVDSGSVADVNDKYLQNNPGAGLLTNTLTALTTNATFGGATTEASLISAIIPANTLQVGTTIRFQLNCSATQTAAITTVTVRIRIGTTTLTGNVAANTGRATPAAVRTASQFMITGGIVIRTVGSGGTALGGVDMDGNYWALSTVAATASVTTAVAVNTTVQNIIECTIQSSVATLTAGNVVFGSMVVDRG